MTEFDRLQQRVTRLEKFATLIAEKTGVAWNEEASMQGPPPVVPSPEQTRTAPAAHRKPAPEPASKQPSGSAEFFIGTKVLPIAAAVVTLLGILALVGVALSRGWLTPSVQFAGELMLCAGFLAIGVRRIGERENFGQILVAVGLSGLYLSFAGAHVSKGLLPAHGVVIAFLSVSLASQLFSWWRSSQAFLGLGLAGGLAAALLPLSRGSADLVPPLILLTLAPAWGLCSKKSWFGWAVASWASMTLAFLAVFTSDLRHLLPVSAAFLAGSLASGWSCLKSAANKNSIKGVTVCIVAAAALPFAFSGPAWSIGGGLALGLAAALLGLSPFVPPARASLALRQAAAAVLLLVAPLGLAEPLIVWAYAVIGVCLAVWARRARSSAGAVIAALAVTVAQVGYLASLAFPRIQSSGEQIALACLLLGSLFVVAPAKAVKDESSGLGAVLSLLAIWLVSRVVFLALSDSNLVSDARLTIGLMASLLLLAPLYRRLGLRQTTILLAMVWTMATGVRLSMYGSGFASAQKELVVLAAIVASGLSLVSLFRSLNPRRQAGIAAAGYCALFFPAYAACGAVLMGLGWSWHASSVSSLAVVVAIGAVTAGRWRCLPLAVASAVSVAMLAVPYLYVGSGDPARWLWSHDQEFVALALVAGALGVVGWSVHRCRPEGLAKIISAELGLAGILVTRVAYLVFILPPFSLQNVYVVELATLVMTLVSAMVALRTRWRAVTVGACINFIVALALFPTMMDPRLGFIVTRETTVTQAQVLSVLVGLIGASLLAARSALRCGANRGLVHHLAVLVNWPLFGGVLSLVLFNAPLRLGAEVSTTAAWTLYAGCLLTAGFAGSSTVLRGWALALFGVTVVKVLVYDLAFLPDVVRACLFLGVGVLMLAAGYGYIRAQSREKLRAE